MRKTFLFILWALSFLPLSAQQGGALPADKAREVMQKLTRTASEIKSMQCSFVQTKTSAKLFDENMYEIQLFDDGKSWRAEMQPKSRSMKRMFTQLTLQFDKQSQRVTEVKFVEAGGDRTTIRFKEVSCNVPIDNSLFVNR